MPANFREMNSKMNPVLYTMYTSTLHNPRINTQEPFHFYLQLGFCSCFLEECRHWHWLIMYFGPLLFVSSFRRGQQGTSRLGYPKYLQLEILLAFVEVFVLKLHPVVHKSVLSFCPSQYFIKNIRPQPPLCKYQAVIKVKFSLFFSPVFYILGTVLPSGTQG